jgi:hypothetical protein
MITIPNIFIAGEAEEVIDEPRPESYSWICLESGTHERMLTDNGTKCGNRFDFTFPVYRQFVQVGAMGAESHGKDTDISHPHRRVCCASM